MLVQKLNDIVSSDQLNSKMHIWSCVLNESELVVNNYYAVLSDDEKLRAANFKLKEIRDRWILARGLLRVLLAKYQQCVPQEIEFRYNEFGKPFASSNSNGNNISFNLAHSNKLVVYIFTQNISVGVDVEKVEELSDIVGVINLCFSDYEKKWFDKVPPAKRKEIFYSVWTSKEAYIKAIGKGFAFSPERISLDINSYKELFFKEIIGDKDFKKWKLISFEPRTDFISSIVVENDDFTIEHFKVDPHSIMAWF